MAVTIDLSNENVNNVKKVTSVSCAVIEPEVLTAAKHGVAKDGTLAVGDSLKLFNLPKDCVIVDAYVVVNEKSNETTAKLSVKAGQMGLISNAELTLDGQVSGSLIKKVTTGTGVEVTCAVMGAELKSGKFSVVVAYHEITRNANGDYTPVTKKL